MNVSEYILEALQKKYSIDKSINLETFNYVESGYVDSLGIIQFVCEIEDEFNISFTDEELSSPSFKIFGQLVKLIESKLYAKK
ncbi:acyl carrier protein [Paenibacillus azoreducens]|uniref:acyl carrier protein n=1 Tax=Paenibacillus azoreducens TaxID=116718 RepID=UPI0039F4C9E9